MSQKNKLKVPNETCNNAQNSRRRIDHDLGSDARSSNFLRFPCNSESSTSNDSAAIGYSGDRLKRGRHAIELTRGRKPDPEPEIGAQDTAELLDAEPRDRVGDLKPGRHLGVIGAGGQPEEADPEPGFGGEVERRVNRVAALEQRLEEASQPLERGRTHPEQELERVRVARDDRVCSVELTELRVGVVCLLLSFAFSGEEGEEREGGGEVGGGEEVVEEERERVSVGIGIGIGGDLEGD